MRNPDFGWSYPPGAQYDPNAPYNQEDDEADDADDSCEFCRGDCGLDCGCFCHEESEPLA